METNCHTHIFNIRCAPDSFIGVKLAKRFSRTPIVGKGLAKFLRLVLPGSRDNLEKISNFLEIGILKTQSQVFDRLRKESDPNTRFVVLTLDMDYMGAGDAVLNFKTQLAQIRELKLTYRERLIPFIGVDPRRGSGEEILEFVRCHIENFGFGGVKMYPPLGFYPFDPNLDLLYAYAQEKQIPILYHCSQGGINFQDSQITHRQIHPLNLDFAPARRVNLDNTEGDLIDYSSMAKPLRRFLGKTWGKQKRNKKFKLNFSNPINYKQVLMKYPKLKICLAHFGGDGQISAFLESKSDRENWHYVTRELMKQYDNVYADISYALWNEKAWPAMTSAMKDPQLKDKVLFGTDFYMTTQEKEEPKLVSDFRKHVSHADFALIAETNPHNFLAIR